MTANVSNLKLVAGDKQITAIWSFSGTGANAVEVKWRPAGQGAWRQAQRLELPTTQTQVTITGLSNGQAYDVQVVPVQYASKSAGASGTPTAPAPVPVPPPNLPPPTIWVSPAGGGIGDSATSPCTLSQALGKMNPGDVVGLLDGIYKSGPNYLNRDGTPDAWITIRAVNPLAAILQFPGTTATSGAMLQARNGTPWGGSHHILFRDLALDGNNALGNGIFGHWGSHHLAVRNCRVQNFGAAGIAFNATDYCEATDNHVYHCGYAQGWSSGISLWNGGPNPTYGGSSAWYDQGPGFHNVIARNVVSGCFDNSGNHSDGNGFIVDGNGSIPPALIAGNVAYHNGGRGIVAYHENGAVWVLNNTCYQNGLDLSVGAGQAGDFMFNYCPSNQRLANNIAYGRQGGIYSSAYCYVTNQSTVDATRNIGHNGNLALGATDTDPLFAAAPPLPGGQVPWAAALPPWQLAAALTPQASSPARAAGVDPRTLPGLDATMITQLQESLSVDVLGAPRDLSALTLGAYA